VTRTIRAQDFSLGACQAVYFTPDEQVSAQKLLRHVVPSWLDVFDGDPQTIPTEAPPEIPRLILRSQSGAWRCQIASQRIDFHWNRTTAPEQFSTPEEFFENVQGHLESYIDSLNARVARLAAVITWFAEHDQPGLFLARHFCKTRWDAAPFNRPASFELHAHKAFKVTDDLTVNSWVRCKTGRQQLEKRTQPIVLVEQDLNTLAEETTTRDYGSEARRNFFALVAKEFPSILRLYFPDEE
jgi:hypothetical protein